MPGMQQFWVESPKSKELFFDTGGTLFDYLYALEFSKWIFIFIYIVEVLKGYYTELLHVEGQVENHMNKVRSYIAHNPVLGRHPQGVKNKSVQGIRILIIDDEPAMLNLLESYLSSKYQVDRAADGEAALKRLAAVRYDVIISDVHMPDVNGIDIYKEAVAADSSLEKKYIFITGDLSPVYRRFFEEYSIPFLYKPISLNIIGDRIREVLAKS